MHGQRKRRRLCLYFGILAQSPACWIFLVILPDILRIMAQTCCFVGTPSLPAGAASYSKVLRSKWLTHWKNWPICRTKPLVYCGHEYTLNNIRFARVVEPGNQALIERQAVVENLRSQGLPTLPSTIALEKATNPFLRCQQPEVIHNASSHAGKQLSDPVSVFATIRDWKNHF